MRSKFGTVEKFPDVANFCAGVKFRFRYVCKDRLVFSLNLQIVEKSFGREKKEDLKYFVGSSFPHLFSVELFY